MKRSLTRLEYVLKDRSYDEVYLIASNNMTGYAFMKWIESSINMSGYKIKIIRYSKIKDLNIKNSIIVLAGMWYKNNIFSNKFMEETFKEALKSNYTIPVDEMEPNT